MKGKLKTKNKQFYANFPRIFQAFQGFNKIYKGLPFKTTYHNNTEQASPTMFLLEYLSKNDTIYLEIYHFQKRYDTGHPGWI